MNRRQFLTLSGGGIASAGMFRFPDAYASNQHVIGKKDISLAIATICCDGFADRNFEPSFAMIPKLPFKNVEFNCWYARNMTLSGIASIQKRCDQYELIPVCVQGAPFGAEGNIVKDAAHKIWNMEMARRLGCTRVKFTGATRNREGGLEAILGVLREIAPIAEDWGIRILLENHLNNNLEAIEDYERIFNEIDSPNVGMCMDNGHFVGSQIDLFEVIDRFYQKIWHVDLKDTRRHGVHDIVPFGEGVTNNVGVIEKLIDYGYSGYLLIEKARRDNMDDETVFAHLQDAYRIFHKYQQ